MFLFWAYLNQYFKNSLLQDKILEYLHVFNKVKVTCNLETSSESFIVLRHTVYKPETTNIVTVRNFKAISDTLT